ncbi:glycerate kinase [Rhodococcus ruber]|uniref:Glycerate kinase n=1 Tax=Rhodococcus ruber TaxID=1830 RepID=A0ABT4MGX0_9NOCA|nr:glycerate kinase [Rhodococcus ruber]MCZ4520227.1 glycerate kinase [Rhodococcus ruber]
MRTRHLLGEIGHVVVAPDKFKGSLTAADAASAISDGLTAVDPSVRIREFPIADGGDGTVDMVLRQGFTAVTCQVTGPLQSTLSATYGWKDGTAVIEMASTAGLSALGSAAPNSTTARTASTRGVGQLISDALDRGARKIVLGVGGSATTDGGAGAVTALGGRILDGDGDSVYPCPSDLGFAHRLDLTGLDPRMADVELVVACDVDNPLLGSHGASAVYAPQKGADTHTVRLLDRALTRWADVVADAVGDDVREVPGVGAAGGIAFGLHAVFGATLVSGIDLLLELTCFEDVLSGASLVIVGEGSLDAQSLRGKGPIGVAASARRAGVPAVAAVGRSSVTSEQATAAGLDGVYALADLEPDPDRSMADARTLLVEVGTRIAREYSTTPTAHRMDVR